MKAAGRLFLLAVLIGALGFILPSQSSAALVTDRGALSANDFIDWGQLGPDYTLVPTPASVVSNQGLGATVTNNDGTTVQALTQGSSWLGNFTQGDHLLYPSGPASTLNISFSSPVFGAGAQIQQVTGTGYFTADVSVFGAGQVLLESYSETGYSDNAGDGSAIFIGVLDTKADITSIQFSLTAQPAFDDFAINTLSLTTVTPTPIPGAVWLLGSGLVGLIGLTRKRCCTE